MIDGRAEVTDSSFSAVMPVFTCQTLREKEWKNLSPCLWMLPNLSFESIRHTQSSNDHLRFTDHIHSKKQRDNVNIPQMKNIKYDIWHLFKFWLLHGLTKSWDVQRFTKVIVKTDTLFQHNPITVNKWLSYELWVTLWMNAMDRFSWVFKKYLLFSCRSNSDSSWIVFTTIVLFEYCVGVLLLSIVLQLCCCNI